MRSWSGVTGACLVTLALTAAACTGGQTSVHEDPVVEAAAPREPVATPVQILAMNDLHGRIAPPPDDEAVAVVDDGPGPDGLPGTADDGTAVLGGAAHLAATVQRVRADFGGPEEDSLLVSAGDLVGASIWASATYADEPTIEVLDALGLVASAAGNHEFDSGQDELFRLSGATDGTYLDDVGACDDVGTAGGSCFRNSAGERFAGAGFPYLAANVVDRDSGRPALPPYEVVTTSTGARIGFIGVVTTDTELFVRPSGLTGLEVEEPVAAANRYVSELQERGVEAIVLLAHEGGRQRPGGRLDSCAGDLAGSPMGELNAGLSPAVDAVVGGHTHSPYTCLLPDPAGQLRPVTQALTSGRSLTDLRFVVRSDGDVDRSSVTVTAVPVTREAEDERIAGVVDHWVQRAAARGDRPVATLVEDVREERAPDGPLGVLVADALLAAVRGPEFGDPVLAFMNHGMLRSDLLRESSGPGDPDGAVTQREVFRVMPMRFPVEVVTVSGADIRATLEQQFTGAPALRLSTSQGLSYRYDPARPAGDRVDPCSLTLDGARIDPAGSYRVAMTAYLREGGDGYTFFADGTDLASHTTGTDALAAHLAAASPVNAPAGGALPTAERLSC
ncbi:bifunctional metallophosphatase/5'-nucleotidase [Blastococcus goldschmidtiae]|uniref:Bifunctional metallophosphatase/5'-nucleotidase n=1 Tax=Blastococcus goldschmidtiae TaxID=3075546 RepID=A0ABU2KAS8_9ACTN|nr:bifunctional metallophosphatase/5'-nucleotidase [Blastococcus sp. DSM 46792]MDT0277291.1 bifunctional metallophosphatase/5'-nucleotidase [Blastococcus sp. DSM 46792]